MSPTQPPHRRQMGTTARRALFSAAACALLALAPHHAARAAESDDVKALRAQLQALQARLDAVEASAKQAAAQAQSATQAANQAAQQVQAAAPMAAAAADSATSNSRIPSLGIHPGKDNSITLGKGVTITPGGFLALETVTRQRNATSDITTSFAGIPLKNSPNYHRSETRESARQSRLSLLAEGYVDPDTKLAAYFEGDFLGAATTANSNQSNSYTPRIRNVYATADWENLGLHLLAGQSWSLLTTNTKGIIPRTEAPPPAIDAQYVVGFNWTRNPGVRLVKDWDKTYWLGIALESPQTINGYAGPLSTNNTNTGGALENSLANYTTDIAPDIIVKGAVDTSFGHYELFTLTRFFQNRATSTAQGTIPVGVRENNTQMGYGIGGSAVIPVIPKYLDFQANAMVGQGVGRYGTSNLPDVTAGPSGNLAPLTEVSAMVGFLGHPASNLDIYLFAGREQVDRKSYAVNGVGYGYGSSLYSNVGCQTEGSTASCVANTRDVNELTLGTWWKFYQGNFGTMQVGLQGAYIKRETFHGIGGAPNTDESEVFTSFRYYPF